MWSEPAPICNARALCVGVRDSAQCGPGQDPESAAPSFSSGAQEMTPTIRNKSGCPGHQRCAANIIQATRRHSGVLRCRMACGQALHRAACRRRVQPRNHHADDAPCGAEGYPGVLKGTRLLDGEHATGTVARATITRCVHAAWHLHPSAVRLRDGMSRWRTQRVPAGTAACVYGRCRHGGSHEACAFVVLCCAARGRRI